MASNAVRRRLIGPPRVPTLLFSLIALVDAMKARWLCSLVCSAVVLCPRVAIAGMPSLRISELARLRIEAISFFLVVFLLSALAVQKLWNWLGRDFQFLPRLSYWKACGLTTLWGLLFVVVLTMISGARELLTPGAWEPTGWTSKLKQLDADAAELQAMLSQRRRERLTALYAELAAYAAEHDGAFPAEDEWQAFADAVAAPPEYEDERYIYLPGRRWDGPAQLLAYEPNLYDDQPLGLFTNGAAALLTPEAIAALAEEASR